MIDDDLSRSYMPFPLQVSSLYELYDTLGHGIVFVLLGLVLTLEISPYKAGEGVPPESLPATQEALHKFIARASTLSVDKFDEYLPLAKR